MQVGGVSLQEAERTRLSVAMERVETLRRLSDQAERGSDGGVVKALNKQLTAVAAEVSHDTIFLSFLSAHAKVLTSLHVAQADLTGRFTLAISALGLVPHNRSARTAAGDTQQRMLRSVRTVLQHIYAVLVRDTHSPRRSCAGRPTDQAGRLLCTAGFRGARPPR